MVALILAVAMQQGMPNAAFTLSVKVVRPACVVVNAQGEPSWSESRRPDPTAIHCTRSSSSSLPPPRLATLAQTVEGIEHRTVEIIY